MPDLDFDDYRRFKHFYDTLKKLIDYNWNFDLVTAKFPNSEIFVIDDKVEEILALLKKRETK